MKKFYPVSQPYLSVKEKKYVEKAVESTWIGSRGEFVDKFNKGFSKYCNRKYSVLTSNGTAAIELALLALDLKRGDEIIVPSFTYIASVNPIVRLGLKPVFVDIDSSLTMNPNDVYKKITNKTKAIILVPLYGHPVDYNKILKIAKQNKIHTIEDAAEAHGSEYFHKKCGQFADISTFSFFGNKIITTGEGGICLTDDKKLFEKMSVICNQGNSPTEKYVHDMIGFNYRMTNVQAAIGLAQLEKINTILKKRQKICDYYINQLQDLANDKKLFFQEVKPWAKLNNWFFSIILNKNIDRNDFIEKLLKNGIDSRPFFTPVHKQKIYPKYNDVSLPVSEDISKRGLNLPTYPDLTKLDVKYICDKIHDILRED